MKFIKVRETDDVEALINLDNVVHIKKLEDEGTIIIQSTRGLSEIEYSEETWNYIINEIARAEKAFKG